MRKGNCMDWRNIAERAAWTFLEGFLVTLPTTLSIEMDGAAWKSALFSAAIAGVSALKTFLLELVKLLKARSEASA